MKMSTKNLDNTSIDILDPVSKKIFISGIYEQPYWIIEFKTDSLNENEHKELKSNKVVAYIIIRQREYPLEDKTSDKQNQSETELEIKNNKVEEPMQVADNSSSNEDSKCNELCSGYSNFENTLRDRKINNLDELTDNGKLDYEPGISENKNLLYSNKAMLWHVRLGHASLKYLNEFQRRYPHIKSFKDVNFDNSVIDCEVCIVAKFNRLPFSSTRQRANEPLQVIHADTMGPISPASHPRGYRFCNGPNYDRSLAINFMLNCQ